MNISSLYNKIVLLSPRIEVFIRCFYWNNIKWLQKFRDASSKKLEVNNNSIDFDKIINVLKENGVKKNDIMVVHSSYDSLKGTSLNPESIIEKLYSLVSEGGTLAMPAIRTFIEEGEGRDFLNNYINKDFTNITTLYDVNRTPIASGLLPFVLMRYDAAALSEFPLNPMTAIGADADAMMERNTDGELPSAHGPNSSWAYCAQKDAWNIGIGVNIKDYLTIFHITQEVADWSIKDWYFKREFIIKRGKKERKLAINERKHLWTKYLAETNFYNDILKAGILKSSFIDNVPVYMTKSSDLIHFIEQQKNKSYPYIIPRKYRK